jgi:phospholipase D1/2
VYIENQYFLGSCYNWAEAQDVGCDHTVCAELVYKIVCKIRAGQRFAAYIVQPMFPEGDPYSGAAPDLMHSCASRFHPTKLWSGPFVGNEGQQRAD